MNATWSRLETTHDSELTIVTMADILAARRAWLRYRGTRARFAALHHPSLPAPTWVALPTERRDKELEELLADRSRRRRAFSPWA